MPRIASWCSASALIVALHAPVANAELWGFVDEAGLAHFASTRLDDRYQLFFRGKTNLDAERESSKHKSTAAFEQTPLYRRVVDHPNVRRFASLIEQSARARALDPSLVKAIIAVESAFEPGAMSAKGALGLMQIIPATAVRYGVVERPGRPRQSNRRVQTAWRALTGTGNYIAVNAFCATNRAKSRRKCRSQTSRT